MSLKDMQDELNTLTARRSELNRELSDAKRDRMQSTAGNIRDSMDNYDR